MGTSSSFGGVKDRKSLLPDDYSESEERQHSKTWKGTRTQLSRHINGNHGSGIERTASNFVGASGGADSLLAKSNAGIKGAINIGNFIYKVYSQGFIKTFSELGISFNGKSVMEIFSLLVNYISSDATTKDDNIAREAAIDATSKIYEYIEIHELNFEVLESVSVESMDFVFCTYVEQYIWGKILNDLEICLEKNEKDIDKIIEMEKELKTYVSHITSVAFNSEGMRNKIFGQKSIEEGVRELYHRCYEKLEEY